MHTCRNCGRREGRFSGSSMVTARVADVCRAEVEIARYNRSFYGHFIVYRCAVTRPILALSRTRAGLRSQRKKHFSFSNKVETPGSGSRSNWKSKTATKIETMSKARACVRCQLCILSVADLEFTPRRRGVGGQIRKSLLYSPVLHKLLVQRKMAGKSPSYRPQNRDVSSNALDEIWQPL